MKREHFDHLIAAAASVSGQREIVVVGSQAVLGSHPDAPPSMLFSMEVDVYPLDDPECAEDIDGSLGDGSPFHRTYGYYAHGVGPETAQAPLGWRDRLVRVEIPARQSKGPTVIALCLEPHDVVLAKLVANRERDMTFAEEALRAGIVDANELQSRCGDLPLNAKGLGRVRAQLDRLIRKAESS